MNSAWTYGVFVIIVMTSLAWVRNLESFRFTFVFLNFFLLSAITLVTAFSGIKIYNEGIKEDIAPIGASSVSFIGYAIYTFEGIGTLMPCMQACECPEKFEEIVIYAIATITVILISYGTLNYLALGAV